MPIPPHIAAWLASLREWATEPGALLRVFQGQHGPIAIYPEDITGRSDAELLAYIRARCAE